MFIFSSLANYNWKKKCIIFQGTNVKEAKALIAKEKGAKIVPNDDLSAAAYTVVTMSKIVKLAKSINIKVRMEVLEESKNSTKKKC